MNTKKQCDISTRVASALGLLFWMVIAGCGEIDENQEVEYREVWESELYSPTQLVELEGRYFLVDCWHNRILYSDELHDDLLKWEVLDGELAGPHSIDTDGHLYVVDDTGRHQLRVYVEGDDGFELVQELDDVGRRPHRVVYDEVTQSFYVVGSWTQTISRLVPDGDGLELKYTMELDFLDEAYIRSMSIIDGKMYFISGPERIHKTRHRDDSYEVIESWRVPPEHRGMNDIFFHDGDWYVTATYNYWDPEFFDENTILRCEDLNDYYDGNCVDLREELGLKGAPYYLSEIDGRIYVPQVFQYSGIVSFVPGVDGAVTEVDVLFDSGTPSEESREERFRLPK